MSRYMTRQRSDGAFATCVALKLLDKVMGPPLPRKQTIHSSML